MTWWRPWFRSRRRAPYSYDDQPFEETPHYDGLDAQVPPCDLDVQVLRVRHPYLNESVAVLAGRLEAVQNERDAMARKIQRLLDERDLWVRMLNLVIAERDVMRDREGQHESTAGASGTSAAAHAAPEPFRAET